MSGSPIDGLFNSDPRVREEACDGSGIGHRCFERGVLRKIQHEREVWQRNVS